MTPGSDIELAIQIADKILFIDPENRTKEQLALLTLAGYGMFTTALLSGGFPSEEDAGKARQFGLNGLTSILEGRQ